MLRKIWKFEEEEKLSQLGFISLAVIEVFEGNWLLIFFQIGDFTKNKEHFLVSFQGLPPRRWQSSKNFDFSEGVLHFNPVWWDNSIEGKLLRRKFLSRAFFSRGDDPFFAKVSLVAENSFSKIQVVFRALFPVHSDVSLWTLVRSIYPANQSVPSHTTLVLDTVPLVLAWIKQLLDRVIHGPFDGADTAINQNSNRILAKLDWRAAKPVGERNLANKTKQNKTKLFPSLLLFLLIMSDSKLKEIKPYRGPCTRYWRPSRCSCGKFFQWHGTS